MSESKSLDDLLINFLQFWEIVSLHKSPFDSPDRDIALSLVQVTASVS